MLPYFMTFLWIFKGQLTQNSNIPTSHHTLTYYVLTNFGTECFIEIGEQKVIKWKAMVENSGTQENQVKALQAALPTESLFVLY